MFSFLPNKLFLEEPKPQAGVVHYNLPQLHNVKQCFHFIRTLVTVILVPALKLDAAQSPQIGSD